MARRKLYVFLIGLILPCLYLRAEDGEDLFSYSGYSFEKVLRGNALFKDSILFTKDSYCLFGKDCLSDIDVSFKARCVNEDEPVQIWAGFRAATHHDRYMVGVRGGLQNDIILFRLGYLGTEEFLAERQLHFSPVPFQWYDIRIQNVGNRIRIFVDNDENPYIDICDKNSYLIPSGKILLGGGWVETEYKDLKLNRIIPDLSEMSQKELSHSANSTNKEEIRKQKRAGYHSINIQYKGDGREEISLNGKWLFKPDYEIKDETLLLDPGADDNDWHLMDVPSFWNPSRIWLHGETMPAANGAESKGISDRYYHSETKRCENYTFDFNKIKSAWYKQKFILPAEAIGRNITLNFDAVARVADVFVNGKKAGSHIGMFGDFSVDISNLCEVGENILLVKVIAKGATDENSENKELDFFYASVRESEQENGKVALNRESQNLNQELIDQLPHGFWNGNPGGIWQPVAIQITNPLKIENVYINPSLNGGEFEIQINNHYPSSRKINLKTIIIDKLDNDTIYKETNLKDIYVAGGKQELYKYNIGGLNPKLWSPSSPNLYDFNFILTDDKGKELDVLKETSGFRTFEIKNGDFYLNDRRYWIRGANQTTFALEPNSLAAADNFMKIMKEGNMEFTRTHNTPWNKLWIEAADRNGLGISLEGTWSWLFIHSTPIPDRHLLDIWADEFLDVIKKYRNNPSVMIWTINNEMKFYDNDADIERAKKKMQIISEVVRRIREIDPSRPICFDSNYQAKGKAEKFGGEFMHSIDDGDIDDMHVYYNWYDYSMFKFFNGEFSERYKLSHRPLISQEFSTGYINGETGHPVRSYQMIHENPLQLIGYDCYDFANPQNFLKTQAFITGELAEATRRSNPDASGIIHFGLISWFKQAYDHNKITPWPTYYALKRGLQPILISAELWGRNVYCGTTISPRIYVVNDDTEGRNLENLKVSWKVIDTNDNILSAGEDEFPDVAYHDRIFKEIPIELPVIQFKQKATLLLTLKENDNIISGNEYELNIADKDSYLGEVKDSVLLIDNDEFGSVLRALNIKYKLLDSVSSLKIVKDKVVIISGDNELLQEEINTLEKFIKKGGKVLLQNAPYLSKHLFPEHINGLVDTWDMADIAFMERNDYEVFNDIEPLDLRYFYNGVREIPTVCNYVFKVKRNPLLTELAGHMRVHGYCDFENPEQHQEKVSEFRGFPLVEIKREQGKAIVSGMALEKSNKDPIAAKLLINILNLLQN